MPLYAYSYDFYDYYNFYDFSIYIIAYFLLFLDDLSLETKSPIAAPAFLVFILVLISRLRFTNESTEEFLDLGLLFFAFAGVKLMVMSSAFTWGIGDKFSFFTVFSINSSFSTFLSSDLRILIVSFSYIVNTCFFPSKFTKIPKIRFR